MNSRNVSKLTVIDDLASETVILSFTGKPVASGSGDTDLICGDCEALLVYGQTASEMGSQYEELELVIQCQCGSYNVVSTDPDNLDISIAPADLGDLPSPNLRAERDKLIAEAAYYRAEKRGFAPGYALEDWLVAEAQVDFELAHARLL